MSYGDELFTLHMQERRITYENARRIHEGWYAEEDDEPVPNSTSDDPWEVLPCGHLRGAVPNGCGCEIA